MNARMSESLDRFITGNYGEDQFEDEPDDFDPRDEEPDDFDERCF